MSQPVEERGLIDPARFANEVAGTYRPVILRGQAAGWPAVEAARRSDAALVSYIATLDSGVPTELLVGPPEIGGRYFYDDEI